MVSEVYVMERNSDKKNKLKCIFSRKLESKAFVSHCENNFYILTNKDGVFDYKIVRLDDKDV
jgi:protease II